MSKILIIDDELINRKQLKKFLDLSGYTTFLAENGEQGLEIFNKEKPDIALVDMMMPGIDGIEVLKRIKKESKETEVIIITGHGVIENATLAIREGAFNFISKPFDPDKLKIDINIALEKHEMKRKLAIEQEKLKNRTQELEETLIQLKSVQDKLIESEKLSTVGLFAAGVAHEINNPMVSLLLGIQDIASELKCENFVNPKDFDYFIKTMERSEMGIQRCKKIVASLLSFARPPKIEYTPTNINQVLENTIEPLDALIKSKKVVIEKQFDFGLPLMDADGDRLSQVFTNMIVNACHAMPKGGMLKIVTRNTDQMVDVLFIDNGSGMSEKTKSKIFDPFFPKLNTVHFWH